MIIFRDNTKQHEKKLNENNVTDTNNFTKNISPKKWSFSIDKDQITNDHQIITARLNDWQWFSLVLRFISHWKECRMARLQQARVECDGTRATCTRTNKKKAENWFVSIETVNAFEVESEMATVCFVAFLCNFSSFTSFFLYDFNGPQRHRIEKKGKKVRRQRLLLVLLANSFSSFPCRDAMNSFICTHTSNERFERNSTKKKKKKKK